MPQQSSSCLHQGRIQALDLVRLFAALSVVVYHYGFRGFAADGFTEAHFETLRPVVKYGYLGVQLFFVISGFVIAYSAAGRTTTEFAIARGARLYPGFVVCMTLTFMVTLLVGEAPFTTSLTQWAANLFMVAPALGQPFMDGSYWSIVYEIVFYGWMALLIAGGLFPRRLREVVVAWLVLSLLNMTLLHSGVVRQLFLTDQSGFFIAGLVLYELYLGERDLAAWLLLAATTVLAADQAIEGANWLRDHFQVAFSDAVIVTISVACVAIVALALIPRRLPLSAGVIAALGGLTYPLYLLHQQVGFILLNLAAGLASPAVLIPAVAAAMLALSFVIWRYIERPGQRLLKSWLVSATSLVQQNLAVVLGAGEASSSAENAEPSGAAPAGRRYELLRRALGTASAIPQIIAMKR